MMKKLITIIFILASFTSFGQRAVSGDTLKIRGGGSFGNTVVMDTSQIKQLDTATNLYDAVPFFQIMDSISGKAGLWQDDGTDVSLIIPRNVSIPDNTIDTKRLLQSNNGGSIFIGEGSGLNDDLTSNYNTIIGIVAAYSNTSGPYNTIAGYNAVHDATSITNNVVIGASALEKIASASLNVIIGTSAARHGTTAVSGSVIIGEQALLNGVSDNGVIIGHSAAINNTGSNNVIIGGLSTGGANADINTIVIGANAIGNGSNTATIGDANVTDVYMGENGQANIHINALHDTENDIGTNGQILSSTSTGTNWIDQLATGAKVDASNISQVEFIIGSDTIVESFDHMHNEYALQTQLSEYISSDSLNNYWSKTEITEEDTTRWGTLQDLSGYAAIDAIVTFNGDVSASFPLNTGGVATIQDDAVEHNMLNDNVISGQTETLVVEGNDEFLISDAGKIKRVKLSTLATAINGLLVSEVTMSSATVANLGTYQTLIAAPGVGKYIRVLTAEVKIIPSDPALEVGTQNLNYFYSSSAINDYFGQILNYRIETTSTIRVGGLGYSQMSHTIYENNSIGVKLHQEVNPASGSATMYFTITYQILDF